MSALTADQISQVRKERGDLADSWIEYLEGDEEGRRVYFLSREEQRRVVADRRRAEDGLF